MDLFTSAFSMLIAGPSRCGKSTFIANLVKYLDGLGSKSPVKKVQWYFKNVNSLPDFSSLKNKNFVTFLKNIPTDLNEIPKDTLLIFDDMMLDCFTKEITEIFTILSHHNNISVILVLHNLFHQSKFTRNITLNAQYIVYFRNPRDMSSISNLTRQLSPQNSKNLQNLFMEVINIPFGYILIDLNQSTPDIFKFRTDIFNPEGYVNCFATPSTIDQFKNENDIFANNLI
jgi:hypothetical protein